jgi:3-deoxy-D-manno-octulosonate 8-phosphate phosphatase KdsC-like HAD superfamily phosphatase
VLKKGNTRDGKGLARVLDPGIAVATISEENCAITRTVAAEPNIDDVFCNASEKHLAIADPFSRSCLGLALPATQPRSLDGAVRAACEPLITARA